MNFLTEADGDAKPVGVLRISEKERVFAQRSI